MNILCFSPRRFFISNGEAKREFVSAQPRGCIIRSHGTGKRLRQSSQHGVARIMAMTIVDRLETVDIDQPAQQGSTVSRA